MNVVLRLGLLLPRDRRSVPLARHVLDSALAVIGVGRECREDIGLAVGEACANAVQHAKDGSSYEVTIAIQDDRCVIDVADEGIDVDPLNLPSIVAGPEDESGRGLRIIRALADVVELRRRNTRGATLRIIKLLPHHLPIPV